MCFYRIAGLSGEEWQPWLASAGRVGGQANLGLLYIPDPIYWNGCRCHRRHPRCHGDVDAHVPETSPPHANSSSRPILIAKNPA